MTSTRYLDKRGFLSLFIWQLRRTLPAAIMYWALMVGLTLWDWFVGRGYYENHHQMEIIIIGFAFALPLVHLGDCFSRRQADFIHALPASRGSSYLSALLNALWQLLIPIVPCRLYTTYVTHWRIIGLEGGSFHILTLGLEAIAILGFMFMAAAATGTYHGYVLAAVAHMAGWKILCLTTYLILVAAIPSTYMGGFLFEKAFFLGAPVGIEFASFDTLTRHLAYVCMPVFGLVCALLGYALYTRRDSEQAGHFGKCRPAELFLRTELTLVAGVAAVALVSAAARGKYWSGAGVPVTLGGALLAVLLAHIILEKAWHRSLKAARKHARFAVIPLGILAVIIGTISTGLGMDTAIPVVSQVEYATVHTIYPFASYDINDIWYVQPMDADWDEDKDRALGLSDGVMSPELLDKVHEFHKKYIELERAAQYPYLPGRSAYETQIYTSVNYTLISQDESGLPGWKHTNIIYSGPINAKTEPLLEELKAIHREILSSDDYINGMKPMVAIDAVASLDKLTEVDGFGVVFSYGAEAEEAPKDVKELPEDFIEGLEAAMRDDFKNCRYATREEMYGADYPIYQLTYKGEFTARGGLLNDGTGVVQAEGMRLKLYEYNDPELVRNGFRVTKEMPATYAYLEKAYN